jgi:hypothetical protein
VNSEPSHEWIDRNGHQLQLGDHVMVAGDHSSTGVVGVIVAIQLDWLDVGWGPAGDRDNPHSPVFSGRDLVWVDSGNE